LLWDPNAQQNQSFGVALWIPSGGVGTTLTNEYDWHSGMGVNFSEATNHNVSGWKDARPMLTQLNQIKQLYQRDYYPLTGFSTANNVWMAWQYDSPESGQGLMQAFRRAYSAVGSMTFQLRGLDPAATYTLTVLDPTGAATTPWNQTGSDLMSTGVAVSLPSVHSSVLITYAKN
ncbi:MAG: GH36 C-terminal domain-containing protein, partial [Sedimentisphaerales bacterium]|nr:GH36 C-terminal domain-containing protein [Sedimentisphaerales bacterium]